MATQFFYLEGEVKWAKVKEPVLKYGSKTEYEWCVDFKPANEAEFLATKTQKKIKDGFAKLSRDPERFDKEGNIVKEEPPKVLIRTEDGTNVPFDGLVGNGSKVIAKIAVYDTRMGKGTRLEGFVVLDLVPYEGTPTAPISTSDGGEVLPF